MTDEKNLKNNWWVYPNFEIEVVASGFELPVNIATVVKTKDEPTAPLLYVTELYGQVKVVAKDGTVHSYAEKLLNYSSTHEFPGSGESGLTGICLEPISGDLFLTMNYLDQEKIKAKVVRTTSQDGLKMDKMKTIIDNIPSTSRAHQIQAVSIGYDGKLYINMADGGDWEKAQDDNDLRGKILRMNLDGSIPWDNPKPKSYIYAKGFRNPFGAAWRKSNQALYISDNGPDHDDRIAKVKPYENYGWPATMRRNSIFYWHNCPAATALDFMQDKQFPPEYNDDLFVALFGASYVKGRGEKGKKIVKIKLSEDDRGVKSYDDFVVYVGQGAASPCGLAFGHDCLYFTDLHGEKNGLTHQPSGTIYKVRPNKEQTQKLKEKEDNYAAIWSDI